MSINMDKHHPTPTSSQDTLSKTELRGLELGEEVKIWKEIAASEARLTLMKRMIQEDLAFTDLENFGEEFNNKLKSIKMKKITMNRKISQPIMKAKLTDEQVWRRELNRTKINMKKELITKYGGEKTRMYRRVVNHLNTIARKNKLALNEKYKQKLNHLRHKKSESKIIDTVEEIPEDLKEFYDLSTFNTAKFEAIEIEKYEIKTVGNVELSDDEIKALQLHNKFSVMENLLPGDLDAEQEASIAKLRMSKEKDERYEGFTEEERKLDEDFEAQNRMIFDPKNQIYDSRKRRVTDLKECARITLPKPLTPEEESKLEVRKNTQKEIFEKYRIKNTDSKGEQKSNLTPAEKRGLDSLKKRIKNEEIIVMKTDKSSRFIVTTPDDYVEMGKEHTAKDEEVSWEKVRDMERRVNSHTRAWEMMWRSGEDHNHQERIVRSRVTRSGNQANLTLLYKDHKPGNKTRPVATGNESYNFGLSNGLSEVMESVARAKDLPYSVISSEDLLARAHRYNSTVVEKPPQK